MGKSFVSPKRRSAASPCSPLTPQKSKDDLTRVHVAFAFFALFKALNMMVEMSLKRIDFWSNFQRFGHFKYTSTSRWNSGRFV